MMSGLLMIAAATLVPQVTAGSHACIDQPILNCIAHIREVARVDQKDIDSQMAAWNQPDISGNLPPPSPKAISTRVALKGQHISNGQFIYIAVDADGMVSSIDAEMPESPEFAKTENDFDNTRLYDLSLIALGSNCFKTKLLLYQFFNEQILKKLETLDRSIQFFPGGASESGGISSKAVAVCGVALSFNRVDGESSADVSSDNLNGYSDISTLVFSRDTEPAVGR